MKKSIWILMSIFMPFFIMGCTSAYEKAKKTDTIKGYEDYIAKTTPPEDEAFLRLNELQYDEAIQSRDLLYIKDYLSQNICKKIKGDQAKRKCESIREKAEKRKYGLLETEVYQLIRKENIFSLKQFINSQGASYKSCKKKPTLCSEHENVLIRKAWNGILKIKEKRERREIARQKRIEAEEKRKQKERQHAIFVEKLRSGKAKYSEADFQENESLSNELVKSLNLLKNVNSISKVIGAKIQLSRCEYEKEYMCPQKRIRDMLSKSSPSHWLYFKHKKLMQVNVSMLYQRSSDPVYTVKNLIDHHGKSGLIDQYQEKSKLAVISPTYKALYLVKKNGINYKIEIKCFASWGHTNVSHEVKVVDDMNQFIKW